MAGVQKTERTEGSDWTSDVSNPSVMIRWRNASRRHLISREELRPRLCRLNLQDSVAVLSAS